MLPPFASRLRATLSSRSTGLSRVLSAGLLTGLALAAPTAAAPQIEAARAKIPVLLVSGANNHDWEWTHTSLRSILEESGLFEVTVTLDPATDLADAELLASMRAVLLDYNGPRWGEPAEAAFVQAVDEGLGVAVVHAANNAFDGWDEYETIVGHLWRKGTGHGRFHAFDVDVVRRDHPITAQLATLRAHPDELYHRLVNTQGVTRDVLMEALSASETGGTGEREPMVLVGRYGAGRLFHTPLGHVWKNNVPSRESHLDPQFRHLIVRGVEWAATGHVRDVDPDAGVVPAELARAGWRSLFDGEDTSSWRALLDEGFPSAGWSVIDRCLVRTGSGGGLITREAFANFELRFEFLLTPGANSGVKLGIQPGGPALGPEYQVLDDRAHPDLPADQTSGALYDVLPAEREGKLLHGPGRWNTARIVRRGTVQEHWLNGRRVARADLADNAWRAAVADSKFADVEDFGVFERGHVLLQDHGDEVWYRNLFVRDLDALPGESVELFDGASTAGWTAHGDAIYEVDAGPEGGILGRIGGGGQSFLVYDQPHGDYLLELQLRNEEPGNSGVQFRSHLRENGRLYGYQMEVDPSDRSWSGGLFDEARRGWLDNLADNPAGRAAFQDGEWNTYRIEAIGPWLRAWVNGVPTMEHVDPLDLEGHLALQVHSGNNTRVRWRAFGLRTLEGSAPRAVEATWRGAPSEASCPFGRGEGHAHAYLDAALTGTGLYRVETPAGAFRVGLARTLSGASLGMAAGAPGFRAAARLVEGGLVFDETIAFSVVELGGDAAQTVHATFLDERLVLHRGGDLVLDTAVPPSRWDDSLQLILCLPPADPAAEVVTSTAWRPF